MRTRTPKTMTRPLTKKKYPHGPGAFWERWPPRSLADQCSMLREGLARRRRSQAARDREPATDVRPLLDQIAAMRITEAIQLAEAFWELLPDPIPPSAADALDRLIKRAAHGERFFEGRIRGAFSALGREVQAYVQRTPNPTFAGLVTFLDSLAGPGHIVLEVTPGRSVEWNDDSGASQETSWGALGRLYRRHVKKLR